MQGRLDHLVSWRHVTLQHLRDQGARRLATALHPGLDATVQHSRVLCIPVTAARDHKESKCATDSGQAILSPRQPQ